jgi:BlaI family transcriptional regulator, penicillinase repressor
MARPKNDVSEAELKVLEALWDRGSSTVRGLTEILYPDGGAKKAATVLKLLERLEEDGYVTRDKGSGAQTFAAAVARDDLIDTRLQRLAAQLCGGSLTPLLTHLVRGDRLSRDERKSLRDLIDDLDDTSRSPKPGRRPRQ